MRKPSINFSLILFRALETEIFRRAQEAEVFTLSSVCKRSTKFPLDEK